MLGFSGAALSVAKGVVSIVVATLTITFMTFFMLLEGPTWVERFFGLMPERSQERWRKKSPTRSTARSAAMSPATC